MWAPFENSLRICKKERKYRVSLPRPSPATESGAFADTEGPTLALFSSQRTCPTVGKQTSKWEEKQNVCFSFLLNSWQFFCIRWILLTRCNCSFPYFWTSVQELKFTIKHLVSFVFVSYCFYDKVSQIYWFLQSVTWSLKRLSWAKTRHPQGFSPERSRGERASPF